MPKNRNKPEYTKKLLNGTVLYINQIGDDKYGNKCFLITDTTGIYDSFVITADGRPLKGEILTGAQERILPLIKTTLEEIISN
jgi:hypothetical protein